MTAYLVRRLGLMLPTLLGVVTLAFVLIRLAPGDPGQIMQEQLGGVMGQDWIEAFRREHGLDRPFYVQYARFVYNVARGKLGVSFRSRQPVTFEISSQVKPTVLLAVSGVVIAAALGIPSGIVAALHRSTALDYWIMVVSMAALASPNFWLALLLVYFFSYRLGWFPFFGAGDGSPGSTAHHLVLPALAIGTRAAALIARMSRSSILQVLGQDYVRTAWAKGLGGARVVTRHVLSNAAIPIITIVGLDIAYLLGGSVIVETIFARPGLGKLLVDAIYARDYPVVQGTILTFGVFVVGINLLVDLIYASVDPRIRYA